MNSLCLWNLCCGISVVESLLWNLCLWILCCGISFGVFVRGLFVVKSLLWNLCLWDLCCGSAVAESLFVESLL